MRFTRPSLKGSLFSAIGLLAVSSLVVILVSDGIHRKLAYNEHRTAIQAQVDLKIEDIISETARHQKELGFRLQGEKEFKESFGDGDYDRLRDWVLLEYNRYFVTAGVLDLHHVWVWDKRFNPLIRTHDVEKTVRAPSTNCMNWITDARRRTGAEQLKAMSGMCVVNDRLMHYSVVTIGGLIPRGYLQTITNPVLNLQQLSEQLGLPIRVRDSAQAILYESESWSELTDSGVHTLVSTSELVDIDDDARLYVESLVDLEPFDASMNRSRNFLMLAVIPLIFVIFWFSLYILQRGLLPLERLQRAASRVADGEFEEVDETSHFAEIETPIQSFNDMVEKLKTAQADNERKTEIILDEKMFSQVTLESLVNGVVVILTSGHIKYLNPAAEKMMGVELADAIGRRIDDVLMVIDEQSRIRQRNLLQRCLSGEHMLGNDPGLILESADGHIRNVEITMSVMRNSSGEVIGVVLVIHDVTQTRELSRQLFYKATHDSLTGLINRYEFEKRLENLLDRSDGEHVLCYMDLDQFKVVNDTCGHIAGDELLRQLTTILKSIVSKRDTLARLGGDEFGLLLEYCPVPRAVRIINEIRDTVKGFKFTWEGQSFVVGCSCGVVKIDDNTLSPASALSAADAACYLAKDSGGDRIQISHPDSAELKQRQGEMKWIGRVRSALEEERLELHMQTIQPLNSGDTTSHIEILVRLREDDELHLPGAFMPAVERYSLQTDLDRYVISHALDWMEKQEPPPETMAINLSGKSLPDRSFLDFIIDRFKEGNIDPSRICFEITETAAITNLAYARTFISKLHDMGCRFSLDDFGSGLSSFAYLKYLPVDYLKIDGVFVRDIADDPMDKTIVYSISSIGKVLNMKTIAEYVENEETLSIVREMGIDYAQGYHISMPVPITQWQPVAKTSVQAR
jgi:diguanylate cyclase (GGDEF)-like protein/PAS domain S-box-containing protein